MFNLSITSTRLWVRLWTPQLTRVFHRGLLRTESSFILRSTGETASQTASLKKKIGNLAIFLGKIIKIENCRLWAGSFLKSAKSINEIELQREFRQAASTPFNPSYHSKVISNRNSDRKMMKMLIWTQQHSKSVCLWMGSRLSKFKVWSVEAKEHYRIWRTSKGISNLSNNCMKSSKNFTINDYSIHYIPYRFYQIFNLWRS